MKEIEQTKEHLILRNHRIMGDTFACEIAPNLLKFDRQSTEIRFTASLIRSARCKIEWQPLRLGRERRAGHFLNVVCFGPFGHRLSFEKLTNFFDGSRSVFIPIEQRANLWLEKFLLPELKSWTYHRLNDSKLNFLISNFSINSKCNQSLWERSSHSFNLVNLWTIINQKKKMHDFPRQLVLYACTMAIFDVYSLIFQHSLNRLFIIKMRWNCVGQLHCRIQFKREKIGANRKMRSKISSNVLSSVWLWLWRE